MRDNIKFGWPRLATPILIFALSWPAHGAESSKARGAYLAAAGGCISCHTDYKNKSPPFAGGGPIRTPFGAFYGPNITPDKEHGIGDWSLKDFRRAMREGIAPDGSHYFPVFPYTAYAAISDRDLEDLWSYLKTLTPVARPNKRHDLSFPNSWRFPITFWKILHFRLGNFQTRPERSSAWNRGAYLVTALAHCTECHTPRNAVGGLRRARWMGGAKNEPEDEIIPNITPHPKHGIGGWSDDDLETYLKDGMDPDGDFADSLMADVIDRSTGKLKTADIRAIIAYLRSIKPLGK